MSCPTTEETRNRPPMIGLHMLLCKPRDMNKELSRQRNEVQATARDANREKRIFLTATRSGQC